MSNLGGVFDASQVPPDSGRDPIPSGEYVCCIVDSAMRPTKDNSGKYLELVHEIMDGPLRGRKVWARLNLVNANQQTVNIAQAQLSAICHAAGTLQVSDSQQLHNRPMLVRVEFVRADGKKRTNDSNEVRGWKAINGTGPAPVQASAFGQPAAAAAPAATGAPPWQRQQGKAA